MKLCWDHQKRNCFLFDRANADLSFADIAPRAIDVTAVREKRSDRMMPDAVSRERRELVDTADREFSGIYIRNIY
jgi:hypothetical protein